MTGVSTITELIRRRWKLIFALVVALEVVMIGSQQGAPASFTSTARVQIAPDQQVDSRMLGYVLLVAESDVVTGRAFEGVEFRLSSHQAKIEQAKKGKGSTILALEVSSSDRQAAADAANAWASEFFETWTRPDGSEVAVDSLLSSRLAEAERRQAELEASVEAAAAALAAATDEEERSLRIEHDLIRTATMGDIGALDEEIRSLSVSQRLVDDAAKPARIELLPEAGPAARRSLLRMAVLSGTVAVVIAFLVALLVEAADASARAARRGRSPC